MTRFSVELPDGIRQRLVARASESGHASLEQHIVALIEADTDGLAEDQALANGPPGLLSSPNEEVETLLEQRIEQGGPSIEVTPDFWQGLRGRVEQHRNA